MTSRLLVYLTLLSVAGGLVTCSDHQFPSLTPGAPTVRLRVKSLTQELPDNIAKVSALKYDGQGRLSSIISYQTPDSSVAEVIYGLYQYDVQNRLTQLQRTAVPYPRASMSTLAELYTYVYNTAGQVSQLSYRDGLTWTFSYNNTGQLAGGTTSYVHPRLSINGDLQFTFTGKNLTQTIGGTRIRYQGMPPGTSDGFAGVTSASYSYDDKINPFYGLFLIPSASSFYVNLLVTGNIPSTLFGGNDNVLTLSQNNVLTETPLSPYEYRPTITYQYQYNSANLPIVRIKTTTFPAPNNSTTVETLRFDYESY